MNKDGVIAVHVGDTVDKLVVELASRFGLSKSKIIRMAVVSFYDTVSNNKEASDED